MGGEGEKRAATGELGCEVEDEFDCGKVFGGALRSVRCTVCVHHGVPETRWWMLDVRQVQLVGSNTRECEIASAIRRIALRGIPG